MYALRRLAVRQARFFEAFYLTFERLMVWLDPVFAAEKVIKGVLFDCKMCGQCVLSSTGMSCPMNCPKSLRNGPCSGVRPDGHCEVVPDMKCVWVDALEGARRMRHGMEKIAVVQPPVDQSSRCAARRHGCGWRAKKRWPSATPRRRRSPGSG
jgi:hypothetical protein